MGGKHRKENMNLGFLFVSLKSLIKHSEKPIKLNFILHLFIERTN